MYMDKPDKTSRNNEESPRRGLPRFLKIGGIVAGSFIGLILLLLCGISLFLTPSRLTEIVNREAGQYLNADIRAHNISYTLWSSFPRFRISTDSITVRSRTLDSIPASIKSQLPENADFLGSLKNFRGSINVVDLFLNRYVIHDVEVDGLRINLVAYNDSINNYNLIPTSGRELKKVPYFSAELIALRNPGALTYFSKATDTQATLRLADLTLRRVVKTRKENEYRLALGGDVTARSAGIDILHDFPFSLDGDLTLRFDPFGVSLSDYEIDLGEIHSTLSMSVGMGDDPRIESFNYHIKSVNLMNLLGYIPKEYIPSLQGLQADMPISASARLLDAWSLSSEDFPSIEVDLNVPEGEIDYTVSTTTAGGKGELRTYSLTHSPIEGHFIFNGEHPADSYLDIRRFNVFASGVNASLQARVTDLTTSPLVQASVGIEADIAKAMNLIPTTSTIDASGHLTSRNEISFRLSSFSREALADGLLDINTSGGFELNDVTLRYPQEQMSIRINRLTARLNDDATALTPGGIDNTMSHITIDVDRADAYTPFGHFEGHSVNLSTLSATPKDITPAALQQGLPLKFDMKAANFRFDNGDSTAFSVTGKDIDIRDIVATTSPQSFRQALSDGLDVKAGSVDVKSGETTFILREPDLHLSVAERNAGFLDSLPAILAIPTASTARQPQKIAGESPAHTPELLSLQMPPAVGRVMNGLHFNTDLKIKRVDMVSHGHPDSDYLADIDLSLNEEALTLRNLSMSLSDTPARIRGEIGNLRGFLTKEASESNPLLLDLYADVDRIDINALSRNYVASKGGEEAVKAHPTSSASDTVALLIPRNIKADIKANVGETDYTNLNLTDLVADISVAGGVADVKRLGLASSFGRAEASFLYDSSDIDNMKVGATLDLKNIDIVKFFAKFHSLLEMMPQMKNLSGFISIDGSLESGLYPTMNLNIPSFQANVDVEGRELLVHQSHFIRKITRMMMIRTDADIHIKDIDVHAGIHDNLLQLYPFNFEFDRYKLHMLGVNNFNGRLYYHIGVEESPLHIPFGINIEGMFHNPKLRFGRAAYDIRKGEEVTEQIQEENTLNLTHMLREAMKAFICTGARYKPE